MKLTRYWMFVYLLFGSGMLLAQKRTFNLVTDFGAKADDKTDCYPALQKAASVMSKAGGGTLVIPNGRYYIAAVKIQGGEKVNKTADIVFRDCNGLTIAGNNSIFRINGNFSRKPGYTIPNLQYRYAFENTVCPFVFSNCRNTVLRDISLYGEADKMKNEGVVEGPSYGVCIFDNDGDTSYNVQLQQVTAQYFAADGFLIRSNGRRIGITGCRASRNARQGLSITKGKEITVYNSVFDSTGITGAYGFHWPAAGIDVENEFKPGDVDNVMIRRCHLRSNTGFQIVTTLPSYNITVDSCFIKDKSGGYGDGLNGVGMYGLNGILTNSIIIGSIQVDLADQIYTADKVQQIKNNIIYTGNRGIICSDFHRPVNIDGNILVVLPKPAETYFPYIQSTNCSFNNNITIMHPDRINTEATQVTSLVQFAKQSSNNLWLLNKHSFAKEWIKGNHYYAVAFTSVKDCKNQFYPVNSFTKSIQSPLIHFVTDEQQDKIISMPLCSAFKQNIFNKQYLQQAAEIRRTAASIAMAAK